MFQFLREYIKYYRKAKRRHGIHSPFVYEFGDECLGIPIDKINRSQIKKVLSSDHHKKYYWSNKECALLFRISKFYHPDVVFLLTPSFAVQETIKFGYQSVKFITPDIKNNNPKISLLYFSLTTGNEAIFRYLLKKGTLPDVVFVSGIRRNREVFRLWKQLIKNSLFHCTMDLFYYGILWLRPTQQKEHFMLK